MELGKPELTEERNPQHRIFPDGRMDTRNASIYLGVKEKTLAMWRCARQGPPYVKRGRIFYYKEDIDRWLRDAVVDPLS